MERSEGVFQLRCHPRPLGSEAPTRTPKTGFRELLGRGNVPVARLEGAQGPHCPPPAARPLHLAAPEFYPFTGSPGFPGICQPL